MAILCIFPTIINVFFFSFIQGLLFFIVRKFKMRWDISFEEHLQ